MDKIDYGSVVVIVPHGAINIVPVGVALDDDLVPGRVAHHCRTTPTFLRIERIAVTTCVGPKVDMALECFEFRIGHIFLPAVQTRHIRTSHLLPQACPSGIFDVRPSPARTRRLF